MKSNIETGLRGSRAGVQKNSNYEIYGKKGLGPIPLPQKKNPGPGMTCKPEMPLPRHHAQLSTCLSPNSSVEVQNISASIVISYQ